MASEWSSGMGLVNLAGAMQGAFAFPMKFARKWLWENIWLASSLVGLVIFPWLIALWTIPFLHRALVSCPPRSVAEVFLFGAGWGVGGLLFGLGVHRVGLSLAVAICLGLTSTVGCVVPLVLFHPQRPLQTTGILVVLAAAVTLAGIILCALAGREREQRASGEPSATGTLRGSYGAGLAICILSGLLSPLFNFALIRGDPVIAAAVRFGARAVTAPNLIWAIAMSGGMIPTAVYCGWLLRQRRTWRDFARTPGHDGLLALSMGALFAFGNALYGMGAENLGGLGAVLGWPVFMALQVVTGNVLGIVTGEWAGARARLWVRLAFGNALLIAAVFLVGFIGP